MVELSSMEQWEKQITSQMITVVKFYTDWCGDCKRIDPFMPEVEEAYAGKVTFLSVDRDRFPELGETLNIFGIPSFVSFYEGKELARFVNRNGKSREEIEHFLDRTIQIGETLRRK